MRRATASVLDALDQIRGRDDQGLPSRRMMLSVGPQSSKADFVREGTRMMRLLVELGGLRPEHDVLDVGCGVGRIAIPLTGYLTARYEGFDVLPESVRWCRENISARHQRFRFRLADIRNGHYNPTGELIASDFRFPYEDESFDFVLHTSVFTHLLPEAAENYARETARVLRRPGTCFATFYLLSDERSRLADEGRLPIRFRSRRPQYWASRDGDPEAAVAYWEKEVTAMFERAGLSPTVHSGRWAGDTGGDGWQDTIVARVTRAADR